MSDDFKFDGDARRIGHVRSGWNIEAMLRRGWLTDRKIGEYERRGYYSDAFRKVRKELWAKKKVAREGGFVMRGGRMIYSP